MMSLYELVENLFDILAMAMYCGVLTEEEIAEVEKLKYIWLTYFEKDLKATIESKEEE